jgi:hypothetical protein
MNRTELVRMFFWNKHLVIEHMKWAPVTRFQDIDEAWNCVSE